MSNMKRVLELIESMGSEASAESVYMRGVADGLAVSADVIEEVMAELAAQEAYDNLTDDAQFEDTVFEITTLDEDGEDAAMIGVTWNWSDAVETAILESALSDSLVMVKTVDSNTDRILFTKIFGGQF